MPRLIYFLLLILFSILALSPSPAKAQKGATPPQVQILVASWCVHCRELEKFLQDQEIAYTRLDIENDRDGKRHYQQLGGGGVPIVIIGNSVLKGFDRNAIMETLGQHERPLF